MPRRWAGEGGQGQVLAAYFGGTQEHKPNVSIWLTVFDNQDTSTPQCVADGVAWHDIATLEDGITKAYSYPAIIEEQAGKCASFIAITS